MSLSVFLLVLASASLHVLWNALVKQCSDKVSFAWLTTVAGTLTLAPLFVGSRVLAPGALDGRVAGLATLSGLIEAGYIIALFLAYERTDLSVAYPLSRGIAPVAGLIPGVVFLGDALTAAQGAGVVLIAAGAAGVTGSALARSRDPAAARRGVVLALATGCLIAGYHVVDRRALTLDPAPAVLEYYFLMHATLLAALTVWGLASRAYRRRLACEWRGNWRGVVAVGVLSVVSYLLILGALRWGNVTLVAATRNLGIVISTVVGALLLRERVDVLRAGGAGCIVAGVLLLLLL